MARIENRRNRRAMVLALAVAMGGGSVAVGQVLAFPGAEGFGRHASGGRGGAVYIVTNLNDSGAGSFRDAVSVNGRTVVFEVSGYINLNSAVAVQDNITIAGQTAPGQGVALRNHSVSFSNSSNTIVRHLKMRHGLTPNFMTDATGGDSLNNVIFDHISAAWGRDETMSVTNSTNVTIQNSIIAEGLLDHSMGGLIEWNTITMHRNLLIANNSRNPKAKGQMNFVNNVVYNWGTDAYILGDSAGISEANVENNYFIRGASSRVQNDPFSRGNANYRMFMSGNYIDTNENGVVDGTLVTQATVDDVVTYMPTPYDYPAVPTVTALQAYDLTVARVGAVPNNRDTVDARLVSNLVNQTGTTISDPATVGGWGTITGGIAPTDTDRDGLPDAWETARGLNPADINDRNNLNAFGYTRLEEYINDLGTVEPDRTWTAAAGTWPTAASWAGGTPTLDEDAFVFGAGAAVNGNVSVSATGAQAFRLYIGGNGAAAGESVTVSGGSLKVTGGITVGYQNKGTLNISGGSVQAAGIGLGNVLNGTYQGTVNFSGGTLATTSIGTTGTGVVNWTGGTLRPLFASLNVSSNVAISGAGGTLDLGTNAATFSGVISGTGAINRLGTGTLTLTGANTNTGPLVVNGGTLAVGLLTNAGTASAVGNTTVDPANLVLNGANLLVLNTSSTNRGLTVTENGATLTTNGAATLTLSGTILSTGTGDRTLTINLGGSATNISGLAGPIADPVAGGKLSLVKTGTGRLSLTTAKTYSGDTIVNNGALLVFQTNVLPNGIGKGNLVVNAPGTIDFRFANVFNGLDGNGNVSQGAGTSQRTITLGSGNANGNYSGNMSSPLTVVKNGTGLQIFSGTNTYTGPTIINAGEMRFGSPLSIGGTGASVTVAASGIVSSGYAIDQAFLGRIGSSSAGTAALTVSSASPLNLSATTGANLPNVRLGATVSSTYSGIITPFDTTYRFGGGTAVLTIAGSNPLTGARGVSITAGGSIALAATTTYTGTTTIDGGDLWLAIDNALPTVPGGGNVTINSGRLLLNSNTSTLGGLSGTGGTVEAVTFRSLLLGNNDASGSYAGQLNGSIVLTKNGTGTQTLGGSSNFTGSTTINAGTLRITHANALGTPGGVTAIVGGTTTNAATSATLALDNNITVAETIQLAGRAGTSGDVPHITNLGGTNTLTGTLLTSSGGNNFNFESSAGRLIVASAYSPVGLTGVRFLKLQGAGNGDFAGTIANGSAVTSLVKTGAGSWSVSGSATYTGDTAATAGQLSFSRALITPIANLSASGTGTVVLAAPASAGAYVVPGHFASINITAGASVVIPAVDRTTQRPKLLVAGVISSAGLLDLTNNDAIFRETTESNVRAAVASWWANGLRNGPGVGSSVAGTGTARDAHATLAVVSNDNGAGGLRLTTFDGVALTTNDVIVKYTFRGDTDLNGVLDGADMANIIEGLSTGATGWASGDVDYSGGPVNVADFLAFKAAYDYVLANNPQSFGNGQGSGTEGGAIPEPSSLTLLAGATLALRRRRR